MAGVMASFAMDARQTRGRRWPEKPHPYRDDYARDRDRVIHSRAFRRLEAKTQVFTTRYSDHFRNRLTHTLEVAQIARTVAGALGLNSDLAEALALVHDIGHPPFGHAGEHALDQLMRQFGDRFDHNLHALRIVEQFEQRYLDFPGLNLTFEVREGIIKHSREYSADEFPDLAEYELDLCPPLEAQLIDLVDEIAYNTADLDDGFEARLLSFDLVCAELPFFAKTYAQIDCAYPGGRAPLKRGEAIKCILNELATDLIENTRERVKNSAVQTVDDIRQAGRRLAGFSAAMAEQNAALKNFLQQRLYAHPSLVEERERSVESLVSLFGYYLENSGSLLDYFAGRTDQQPRHRVVCDYIAGMTDHFLLRQYRELHVGFRDSLKPIAGS
jgi:dGTPase